MLIVVKIQEFAAAGSSGLCESRRMMINDFRTQQDINNLRVGFPEARECEVEVSVM